MRPSRSRPDGRGGEQEVEQQGIDGGHRDRVEVAQGVAFLDMLQPCNLTPGGNRQYGGHGLGVGPEAAKRIVGASRRVGQWQAEPERAKASGPG